ncbi:hypothetical protein T440DRAFT_509903 [Plenodomus tracheiphilus IPT5]|uniref:DUF7730 domain-containing protein n=1 Tax=Plenodomus tracheiphilus IPT5 TaxID=1408161 RepID=A0A6A7B0M6_9PLEO|nr:hypothetical protein T440DRAFT_509903 [Plenodomus tracheiphilus IPT5]
MGCRREWLKAKWKALAEKKARGRLKAKADALTLLNQKNSPFLRLPSEIRNLIYGFVVEGVITRSFNPKSLHFTSTTCSHATPTQKFDSDDESPARFISLLSVCRQINSETYILPFKLNAFGSFRIQDLGDYLNEFAPWQRNAITTVRFISQNLCPKPGQLSCGCDLCVYLVHDDEAIREAFATLPDLPSLKRIVVVESGSGSEKLPGEAAIRECKLAGIWAGIGPPSLGPCFGPGGVEVSFV